MTVVTRFQISPTGYTEVVSSSETTADGMSTTITVIEHSGATPVVFPVAETPSVAPVSEEPSVESPVGEEPQESAADSPEGDVADDPVEDTDSADNPESPVPLGSSEVINPVSQPEGVSLSDAVSAKTFVAIPVTRKQRAGAGLIRGIYTAGFSLLGMLGAAFAYLKDNLSQLSNLSKGTIAIVVGGAVLAGLLYGLKKYWVPTGVL